MAAANAGDRRASGAIAGRISMPSGTAAVGARVMIGGDSPTHVDIAAVTGPSGEYRFDGLTPGNYEIQVNVRDRLQVQRVQVSAGDVARLDFVAEA
jgi:Carboxypeptidase regulatory-like domain